MTDCVHEMQEVDNSSLWAEKSEGGNGASAARECGVPPGAAPEHALAPAVTAAEARRLFNGTPLLASDTGRCRWILQSCCRSHRGGAPGCKQGIRYDPEQDQLCAFLPSRPLPSSAIHYSSLIEKWIPRTSPSPPSPTDMGTFAEPDFARDPGFPDSGRKCGDCGGDFRYGTDNRCCNNHAGRLKRRRRPSPELDDLSPLSDLGYASDEYCFLSITRDVAMDTVESSVEVQESTVMSTSGDKESMCLEQSAKSGPLSSSPLGEVKSPPLITITIPSHARIIPRQPSIRLSSDSDESSDAGLSDPDLSPRALTPTPRTTAWGSWERIIFMHRPNPRVSVMCYNILSDKYATTAQYSYCPSWALGWEYRKGKILEEILHCNADILSLQEIETAEYESYFEPSLAKHGYDGIFSPKSRAKTMLEDERKFVDGCAIFWKREKFSLEGKHPIEFTQLAIAYAEGSEQMLNRVMTRDNIALVAVLSLRPGVFGDDKPVEPRLISRPIIVCAAHIHWDPEFCDVKLIQAMMLLQEVARIRAAAVPASPDQVPVLLCGDLNSLPDSGVFEFLSSGRVSKAHADFRAFVGDPCLDRVIPAQDGTHFTHSLDLNSAYDPDVMPFTNYTFDFRGVIDYVFGSRGLLARTGVLGPLDPDWFRVNKVAGCPHPLIPSDHLPLLAEFSLL